MGEGTDDRWAAGDAYEAYMGRWSRPMARAFLGWLGAERDRHWLEVGCGSGALTAAICAQCAPASIVACEQSAPFVEHLRAHPIDGRVSYVVAAADALPTREGGFDRIVSGLVLNFIPEPAPALAAMAERCRRDGVVAAYLWDYAGGVDLLHHFWQAAVACDPAAAALDEARRFARWDLSYATSLFEGAGLSMVEASTLTVPTPFSGFDDYWQPLLGGTGPAPSYVASLAPTQREQLAERLRASLPRAANGTLPLEARALVLRGVRA